MFRIGFSKDIHKITKRENSEIILGGIKIKADIEIESVSDGDIVFHALAEAILGALGLNDLGTYFPERKSKNINSLKILKFAHEKMIEKKYSFQNIDILIMIDEVILKNYKNLIKQNLIKILKIESDMLAFKATRSENLFPNHIVCYANLILKKN